jgi:hypothetical protein
MLKLQNEGDKEELFDSAFLFEILISYQDPWMRRDNESSKAHLLSLRLGWVVGVIEF